MKVTRQEKQFAFKPFTLSIDVESKQDYLALKQFFGFDKSIPRRAVECGDLSFEYEDQISYLMGTIYGELGEEQ